MSFSILIGALVAPWVYRDAKKKWGYSRNTALLWALATVVSFYIVIPVYFIFGRKLQMVKSTPTDTSTIEGEAVDVSEKADCPMCASKVPVSFEKCPHCGYTLKFVCSKCGRDIKRDWKTCPYCGELTPEK